MIALAMMSPSSLLVAQELQETARENNIPVLQVPAGFVAERVAGSPLMQFPMFACFDDQGRLYVVDSLGINLVRREDLVHIPANLTGLPNIPAVHDALKNPRMVIRRLEDCDGDGHFDKSIVFADRLTYPQGIMWHEGAIYTVSPPGLWRLEDSDGDGQADKRQELVTGLILTGAADDAHGPMLGQDGRVYFCHGRFGHELRGPDGASLMRGPGPRIYRCRPDGSDVEMLSAALGNAVEVAFTPEGEAIACGTFFSVGPGAERDALIHCVEGGVFPVRSRGITETRLTGDLLPAVVSLGADAPSGLMRYAGGAFGADYENSLFMASFNRHHVQRYVLERDGATFRSHPQEFLVSTSSDFHPTDVLEDADGSLLVVDTGTWFDDCPTAGLGKTPVPGAIYRIRRQGGSVPADPRGLKLNWERLTPIELAPLLDDARWAVRERAIQKFANKGEAGVPILQEVLLKNTSEQALRHALWVLSRIEGPAARAAIRLGLADPHDSVRLTAVTAVGFHRDVDALARVQELIKSDSLPIRREAATALGRIGRATAVPALFEGLRVGGDRFLEHALIYALIQIDDRAAILPGLRDPSPQVRRSTLIALDRMDHGELTQQLVTPLLDTDDPALQKTALTVLSTRGWATEIVSLLRLWLAEETVPADRQESLRGAVLALCSDPAIQDLVAETLQRDQTPVATRLLLLETIARTPLEKLPRHWIQELGRGLKHPDERVLRQSLVTLRATGVSDFDQVLVRLAKDPGWSADVRMAAWLAVAHRESSIDPGLLEFLKARLDGELTSLVRLDAAFALGNSRLDDRQLEGLTEVMASVGALELPHLVAAFARSRNLIVGKKLLFALASSPGRTSLSSDILRRTLQSYPAEVRDAAQSLFKEIEENAAEMISRLDELAPLLKAGDARKGQDVFFGKKANCSACHTVQAVGGQLGPNLSRIGAVRTARDLIEAVVFPSASLARGYEPYTVEMSQGLVYAGILRRETAEAIYLATADRAEIRLPRSGIDALVPSRISVMPKGLDTQLSQIELSHLIAFLTSLK